MNASPTLERIAGESPERAAYIAHLIDWCAVEGPRFARASVAAEAVRGVVRVASDEWRVLVEVYAEPSAPDWKTAQRTYGPTLHVPVEGGATEATCQGCESCAFGATFPCPSQTGVWFANHPEVLS